MWGFRKKALVRRFATRLAPLDQAVIEALADPELLYTDSTDGQVRGARSFIDGLLAMERAGLLFEIDVGRISLRGEDVLVSGVVRSDDARFAGPCLWRARVAGGRVTEWQSFSAGHHATARTMQNLRPDG